MVLITVVDQLQLNMKNAINTLLNLAVESHLREWGNYLLSY